MSHIYVMKIRSHFLDDSYMHRKIFISSDECHSAVSALLSALHLRHYGIHPFDVAPGRDLQNGDGDRPQWVKYLKYTLHVHVRSTLLHVLTLCCQQQQTITGAIVDKVYDKFSVNKPQRVSEICWSLVPEWHKRPQTGIWTALQVLHTRIRQLFY